MIVHLSNCCLLLHWRLLRKNIQVSKKHMLQETMTATLCHLFSAWFMAEQGLVLLILWSVQRKCKSNWDIIIVVLLRWQFSVKSCVCLSPTIESTKVLKTFFSQASVLAIFNAVFSWRKSDLGLYKQDLQHNRCKAVGQISVLLHLEYFYVIRARMKLLSWGTLFKSQTAKSEFASLLHNGWKMSS